MQPLRYGHIGEVGLLQDLATYSSILRKNAFQFDHETSLFAQHFEELVGRGPHAVKVVRDDVGRAHGCTRRSSRTGPFLCTLLGLLLWLRRRDGETNGQQQSAGLPRCPATSCTLLNVPASHQLPPPAAFLDLASPIDRLFRWFPMMRSEFRLKPARKPGPGDLAAAPITKLRRPLQQSFERR